MSPSPEQTGLRERAALRRQIRQQRRTLDAFQRRQASQRLCRHLLNHPDVLRARRVALYLPNDGEIDPTGILTPARLGRTQIYLPVLAPLAKGFLWFSPWDGGEDTLRINRFGIAEPDPARARHVPPWSLDLVLMPLVAFDRNGNRLGMGGGFYDRTFAACCRWPRRPRLVGVAYGFQEVPALPRAAWDIPLDAVITD